jgi:RNA polymerase sigma factor (sigma-70 family)
MSAPSDSDLLRAWQQGDAWAFEELTRRHYVSIRRFFDLRVPGAADDLTQQTFLGALEAASRFRGDASFRTFVFAIAHKQLLRSLRERPAALERFGVDESPTSLSMIAVRQQEHQFLLMALTQLPLELQLVTELYYWENLRTAEIGEALSLNPSTVAGRLARARDLLGEHITQMTRPGPLRDRLLGDLEQITRALGPVTALANTR